MTNRLAIVTALCICWGFAENPHLALRVFAEDQVQGTRTFSVAGAVSDEQGNPVPEVEIQYVYRLEDKKKSETKSTRTNLQGQYRFDALPVADPSIGYLNSIRASKNGFAVAQRNYNVGWLHNRAGNAKDDLRVDIILPREVVGKLQVFDSQGNPLAGAQLESIQSKTPDLTTIWAFENDPLLDSMTGDNGILEIRGLEAGVRYDLEISHPDYATTPVWNLRFDEGAYEVTMDPGIEVEFTVTCPSDPTAVAAASIVVSASELSGHQFLTFPVDPSGVVKARLRTNGHANIRIEHPTLEGVPWYFFKANEPKMEFQLLRTGVAQGTVIDASTGQAASGVGVYVVQDNKVMKSTSSDENGNYEVTVAEGSYTINLSDSSKWRRSDEKHQILIKANEISRVPSLSAQPNPAIKGQVVLASGDPVPYAFIISEFRRKILLCDDQGRFELQASNLFGNVPIQAFHPHEKLSRVVTANSNSKELKIELQPEASVLGVVVDSNGESLGNFPVCIHARVSSVQTTLRRFKTREDGTFILNGLSPGYAYKMAVSGEESSAFSFSDTLSVSNPWFESKGIRIERQPLVVGNELLRQVREMERASKLDGDTLIPLDDYKWLKRLPERETKAKRWTLLCFLYPYIIDPSTESLEHVEKYYGKDDVRIIAVVSPADDSAKLSEMRFGGKNIEVVEDTEDAQLMKAYQVDRNDMPTSIMFDPNGDQIFRSIRNSQLLTLVRESVLYEEE